MVLHLLSNATREAIIAEPEGSGAEGASHTNVTMMVPCGWRFIAVTVRTLGIGTPRLAICNTPIFFTFKNGEELKTESKSMFGLDKDERIPLLKHGSTYLYALTGNRVSIRQDYRPLIRHHETDI